MLDIVPHAEPDWSKKRCRRGGFIRGDDKSQSGGRYATGQHSVLSAGKVNRSSGIHGWQVDVPSSV